MNASDPRFIALVGTSETNDDLPLVAAEAAALGKGWAWFLAVAEGRRRDQATKAAMPQQATKTARQRADEATVQAWVPQLAAKPVEGR